MNKIVAIVLIALSASCEKKPIPEPVEECTPEVITYYPVELLNEEIKTLQKAARANGYCRVEVLERLENDQLVLRWPIKK